jgi:hypothetical protein
MTADCEAQHESAVHVHFRFACAVGILFFGGLIPSLPVCRCQRLGGAGAFSF